MASPARPTAASVSGAFGLSPDAAHSSARCSFDQTRRREDFQDSRLLMSFVKIHEQESHSKEIITAAVENCMKKQADNLLHSLEVISGRLSQLELNCYKLERSIGELRSDVMDYHSEANLNSRCLEKHLQEVQKSVQTLQDKQELAESQRELTKPKIVHEEPAKKYEGIASSMLMAKEGDDSIQVAKHELALVPLHQVNQVQSPMQFQSCNGLVLQQLVPVSLSTQQDQQHLNQATVYYMQSQSHAEHRQAQPSQPALQTVQPHGQNPQAQAVVEVHQATSQAPELYLQSQQQWPQQPGQQVQSHVPQPQTQVQQQQYNIPQVPAQIVQLQTSSPQAQSAPQVTHLYPPYGSHQPSIATTEPRSRCMVAQPSYSTISSPQRKHHEVVPPIYVQSSTISLPPLAEHNLQHQQPQQLQPLSSGSFGPQPSKLGLCGVASYTIQGSSQAYSTPYGNPSNSSAPVVAVLPQQTPASAPMVLHHLGPQQTLQHHPFGEMVEKSSRMGYSRDQVESMTLHMVTAGQPVEFNALLERPNSGGNVATPQPWSG